MGRVSTDRKVYMEPEEEHSTASCSSSPRDTATKRVTYNHTNSNGTTATPTTTEGGTSTFIKSGLKKLASLNIPTRRKGPNVYEQIQEEQRPPSPDTTHAAAGRIFSTHHRSNTFGAFGASRHHHYHRGEGKGIVRIDDPSSTAAGAEPTSNGVNFVVASSVSGDPRYSSVSSPPDLGGTIEQPSSSLHAPLLQELDSFDIEEDSDEHFNRKQAVNSPSVAIAAPGAGVQANSVPEGLPFCPPNRVHFTESTKREGNGGGSQAGSLGIESEGSYNFRNDLPLPRREASSSIDSGGASSCPSSNSSRRKAKSFDFGTVAEDDPPTKLIGAFLRRQTESGSNFLDLDLEMEELTPIPKPGNESDLSPLASGDLEDQTPSPEKNWLVKDTSYQDLVSLDPPVTSSVPTSFKAGTPIAQDAEELRRWKEQLTKNHSDPLAFPQEWKQDVRINVEGDERFAKGQEGAARAATAMRTPSPETGGLDSPTGVRWRKNGSFRPSPSPPRNSAEEEVLKAPAQFVAKPSFSQQKSRLADLPKPSKPLDAVKASGAIDENKMKSAQVKNSRELKSGLMGKLKAVQEEEEEDPLKDSDLPEKYRRREHGFWTILQFSALLLIIATMVCVLSFPKLRKMNRGGLDLWKWVLLVMVVFCGRLISGWIIWVFVFIIEKNFLLRKRVVYFVYALRIGVQNCLWLGLALLAWHFMVDPKVSNRIAVRYVTKVLICFLVAAFIILFKTLVVKVLASSFHVNNYFERIQEAVFDQYIMETLTGPPMVEYELEFDDEKRLAEEIAGLRDAGASGPSLSKVPNLPPLSKTSGLPPRPSVGTKSTMIGAQSGMIGSQQLKSGGVSGAKIGRSPKVDQRKKKSRTHAELNLGISVEHLQKLDMSNISAFNMKRLMHIIRNSTLTHSLEETANSAEGAETEIQSEWQAKKAAKQIFKNVAKPGARLIMEDDLLRFMGEEETKKALEYFDGARETKCITKQALKKWVIRVFKERRSLALSLNDTKTAVNKLHRIIDVLVGIIIIIIWLLVLGIATTKLLLFMSSQFLLLILIWGNTLKTVFEAIIFLFVMHPFDVGDRCVVDGKELVVEEMNILTTVFLGDFDAKVWYPNSVLATKAIQNFYRSPEMGDGVDFVVHSSTSVDKISAFKEKIGIYIHSKPNHWHKDYSLNVSSMSEGDRLTLSLGLTHTMNYQDMGEIVKRKSELLFEVKTCLQSLGIEYHLPAQEVFIRQKDKLEGSLSSLSRGH